MELARLGRVIVLVKDEDQLALGIGRDGINVRSASKLISPAEHLVVFSYVRRHLRGLVHQRASKATVTAVIE